MNLFIQRGVLCISCLFLSFFSYAQVNTPAGATWPFGSRIQADPTPYDYGIIPTNLPTGAYNPGSNQYGKSQDAYDAYVAWKSCYVYDCGGGEMRVRFDNPSQTVSEGIAYGMLLAAYAADQNLFNGLWTYYLNRANGNGFMNWHINDGGASSCGSGIIGSNGAADSELDAAMALIVAACQWPNATSPYDYSNEAEYLISRIRQFEISTCSPGTNQISNGDGWIGGCPGTHTCRNPSYQTPAYVRAFQGFDPGAPAGFWNTVLGTIYPMMNNNVNGTTGLVSNWCDPNGNPNSCGPTTNEHGYDAIRSPWRIGVDYLWWGETQARDNFNQPMSSWLRTKSCTYTCWGNVKGPVNQDGSFNGNTTGAPTSHFVSMWAVASMGVDNVGNNQTTLDGMYDRTRIVQEPYNCTGNPSNYFGMTLRAISLFAMSGNFWKPCPPRCQAPEFGADSTSLCGETSIILDSGLPSAANRTFAWYKDNNPISGTNPTRTVTTGDGPGWYKVQVDSLTSPVCSQFDSIYVSTFAVDPELGPNTRLCDPISATLDAGIVGTGYTYEWYYASSGNYADLSQRDGTTSSITATATGLYQVRVSKSGCADREDTVRISSSVVSPIDACEQISPSTVTLEVGGPNLGPCTQYDWYTTSTGGSPISTGCTYTTPSLSTGQYTYYVKDKSKIYGTIGKQEPTNFIDFSSFTDPQAAGPTGESINPCDQYQQTWDITSTIDIDSVTVYFVMWANDARPVQFQLLDNANSPITTTPDRAPQYYVNAPGSYPDGQIVGARYYVGFNGVTPGTYKLRVVLMNPDYAPQNAGLNCNLYVEENPAISYNYTDNLDGVSATITNTQDPGNSATFLDRYAHMYDWSIGKINECERVPVVAYVGSCPVGLPVELASFEVENQNNKSVEISWSTASEKNSAYFVVQRSLDGKIFSAIGTIEAGGNSIERKDYVFTDENPVKGPTVYYRLVMYDIDGSYSHGPVRSISLLDDRFAKIQPNPFNDQTMISVDPGQDIHYKVYTLQGKIVSEGNSGGEQTVAVGGNIPKGAYIIQLSNGTAIETYKLIKE